MNLFQLDAQMDLVFANAIDTETGEIINEEAFNSLEDLQMERDQKIDNIGKYIKNLSSDIKQLKEQEKLFKDRREAAERKMQSLSTYLQSYLDGQKWYAKDGSFTVGYRRSVSVDITDADLLPSDYVTTKTTSSPNKTAIKQAINEGIEVPGAQLVEKENMTIK